MEPRSINDGVNAQSEPGIVDSLVVRELLVLDSVSVGGTKDTASITLSDDAYGGNVTINAKEGEGTITMGMFPRGRAGLHIGRTGRGSVGMEVGEDGNGSLIIKADKGEGAVGLTTHDGEGGIALMSKTGEMKIVMGVKERAGVVAVVDKFGNVSVLE